MSSLKRTAGELMIDHRASPGTPDVPEGKVLEVQTYTCSHCCRVVVMNERRTRDREVCLRCMAIICDPCAKQRARRGACTPFIAQYMDQPGVIISTAGAPARTTPDPSPAGLILPGQF